MSVTLAFGSKYQALEVALKFGIGAAPLFPTRKGCAWSEDCVKDLPVPPLSKSHNSSRNELPEKQCLVFAGKATPESSQTL